MSGWDDYVSNLLKGGLSKAAVVGIDGNIWAKSSGFQLTPGECKEILAGFGNIPKMSANGIHAGGQKFMYLQSDDRQMQGKKGNTGVAIAKTNKCMIVGEYADGMQPGQARVTVEGLVDYLKEVGY